MEPEGSLPLPKEPATYLYTEPEQSTPLPHSIAKKIYFNIIQSCTLRPKHNIIKICNFIFFKGLQTWKMMGWECS